MRRILLILMLVSISASVSAQTYLGVLTVPANKGPGGSCCSTVAKLTASNASVPNDGSCSGCTVITPAQYAAYQNAVVSIAPKKVQSILVAGLAVTFSSTTSANATYAADPATLLLYQEQVNNLSVAGVFTGATALLSVKDVNGTPHGMNTAAFKAFYAALQAYASQVNTAQTNAIANNTLPSWPPTTANVTG